MSENNLWLLPPWLGCLSERLQGTPGIMPGISSVMCIILLYSGWWETDTDGRTGTIFPSFEGIASTLPLLAMSVPQPVLQTHVPRLLHFWSSQCWFPKKKILPVHSKQEKNILWKEWDKQSVLTGCVCGHTLKCCCSSSSLHSPAPRLLFGDTPIQLGQRGWAAGDSPGVTDNFLRSYRCFSTSRVEGWMVIYLVRSETCCPWIQLVISDLAMWCKRGLGSSGTPSSAPSSAPSSRSSPWIWWHAPLHGNISLGQSLWWVWRTKAPQSKQTPSFPLTSKPDSANSSSRAAWEHGAVWPCRSATGRGVTGGFGKALQPNGNFLQRPPNFPMPLDQCPASHTGAWSPAVSPPLETLVHLLRGYSA